MKSSSSRCQSHTHAVWKKLKTTRGAFLNDCLLPSFTFAGSRPRRLLVYINPYGGKRRGKRIYEQKVAPLFRLASISTDVIGVSLSAAYVNILNKILALMASK